MFFNSFRYSFIEAKENYQRYTMPVKTMQALDWLDKNTGPDSVVMTPSFVNNYFIPMYAHNRIFIPSALNTLSPEKEVLERLSITYKIFEVNTNYLSVILNPELGDDFGKGGGNIFDKYEQAGVLYLFALKYADRQIDSYTINYNDPKYILPLKRYEQIRHDYDNFNCGDCLANYRADYI